MILTVLVWLSWYRKEQYLGSQEHLQECPAFIMTWHSHHYDTYSFSRALLVSEAILLRQSGTPSGVCCLDHDRDMAHSPLQYLHFSLALQGSQAISLRQSRTPWRVCCMNHDIDMAHLPLQYLRF